MKNQFISNILILLRGSTIAQIITILSYLILTQLYTPEAFGEFSLVFSIITIISVVATLRIDQSIPISTTNFQARKLLFSSIYLSVIIGFISILIAFILGGFVESYGVVKKYSIIIGLTVFLVGLKQAFTSYSVYNNQFKINSNNQVLRATSLNTSQLLLYNFGSIGLIISQPIGHIIGNIIFLKKYFEDIKGIIYFEKSQFLSVIKEYRDFILLLSPATLINTISSNLPILVFTISFDEYLVGLYALAFRILITPISMVSSAISQPFLKKMTDNKNDMNFLNSFLSNLLGNLIFFITIPLLLVFLFSESIFGFVFSSEWGEIYKVVNILIPWLIVIFLTGPISQIYTVYRKHDLNLKYNIFALTIKVTGLLIFTTNFDFYMSLKLYVIINIVLTIFQFVLLMNIVRINKILIYKEIIKSILMTISILSPIIFVRLFIESDIYIELTVAILSFIIYIMLLLKRLRGGFI